MVLDEDMTVAAAAASSDAVATNAMNATNAIGPRGARDLRGAAETWLLCLEHIILLWCIVCTYLHNICRYLQISAQISAGICAAIWSGHASRYLVTLRRHLT
jgi:hypothetical protein